MNSPYASPRVTPRAPVSISSDELVVLQLLEEIQHLIAPGRLVGTESPRLHAAAKLYLDTRDTFEAIEQHVEDHVLERPKLLRKLSRRASSNKASEIAAGQASAFELVDENTIERIQDMFRRLGEKLGPFILKEVRQRKLSVQSILHYVRFLPADCQWSAYKQARQDEVALAYIESHSASKTPRAAAPSTTLESQNMLKHNAEFIKQQIRKDVDTVCLFSADGKLTTIFGDDIKTDEASVAEKFESLIMDVYSPYLKSTIQTQMDQIIHVSDQWERETASGSGRILDMPPLIVQHFARARKFRTKANIFPDMLYTLEDRYIAVPPTPPGQVPKLLVADHLHVGVWWQKSVTSATDRDVIIFQQNDIEGSSNPMESLDGHLYVPLDNETNLDLSRRVARSGGFAKLVGQHVLVNNGKDSLWVEVLILEVEERKCKLELKKSIQNYHEVSNWQQVLSMNNWLAIRDLRFCAVPTNPIFRVHMGFKFRDMLEVAQSVMVEISSILPNDELNNKVGKALWRSVEDAISTGEHIFARYFRSTLNHEPMTKRTVARRQSYERSLSATSTVRNLVAALENTAFANGSISSGSAVVPYAGPLANAAIPTAVDAAALIGKFDEHGCYQPPAVANNANSARSSLQVLSPYERIAHHLLEETEIIGPCIQANNIAIGRALVQVFQEKLEKLARNVQALLERDETSPQEVTLDEYANLCRFLYVWRICRHQLDMITRQDRLIKEGNTIHTDWIDRAFERAERTILKMINLKLHYVHRAFFHECSSLVLPGVYEQAWASSKPWFANSRCTYSVQFFIFRLQMVFEHITTKILPQFERNLGVHDKMQDLASWMILDILPCLAASYDNLVVSRARMTQWKIDVLYLICGIHKLLRILDRMLIPKINHDERKARKQPNEIRAICLRLLTSVALRSGPADIVLSAITKKIEGENYEVPLDATAELEIHINSIYMTLDLKQLLTKNPVEESGRALWSIHSIFEDMDLRKLGEVSLNWSALISRSSLSKENLLDALQQRHELGNWQFPQLSDAELQMREEILKFLNNGDIEIGSTSSRKDIDDQTNPNDEPSFSDGGNSLPQPSDVEIEASAAVNKDIATGTPAAATTTTDVATEEELLAFARKSGDGCGESDAGSIQ